MPGMRTSFRFYLGRSWCFEPTMAWGCVISLKVVEQNNPQLTTIAWGVVSVCLPSYALSLCLPSYLGFSYFARGLSLHGCSSKAQLLTLEVWLLLSATAPDLGRRVAPFSQSQSCAIVAATLLRETVEVRNRFKGLDLIDSTWWNTDGDSWCCTRDRNQDHPQEKKSKKAKWLSEEALQIAVKRREAKNKGQKER